MKEKQRRGWKRRVVSALVCLAIGWLVYAEAMNLTAWHFAKEWSRTHQNLAIVPTPLRDTTADKLDGALIQKFGFSFEVPWKDVESDRTTKSVAVISFKEGGGMLIFDPTSEVDGAKIMRGKTAQQQKMMNEVFGSRTLSSNYELMSAEVKATPAEVKWWAMRAQNVRNLILLTNKSINVSNVRAIHSISSNGVRGFQYGDPNDSPYFVQLDLFDVSDNHYKVIITGKRENRPVITQAQINAFVASFRVLPTGTVSSSPSSGS